MTKARVVILAILFMVFVLPIVGGTPQAPPPGPAFVPGEILLKFKDTAAFADRVRVRADLGATTLHTFHSQAEHWRIAASADILKIVARLKADPAIAYAEPNYLLHLNLVPNDPRLGELWGMINTGQSGGTADADIDADLTPGTCPPAART